MWFDFSLLGNDVEVAIVDPEKGKVIKPIHGTWAWAREESNIVFSEINLFENCYRDIIQIVFGSDKILKKYKRIVNTRFNKREKEKTLNRSIEDLRKWSQIVGH